jgi:hypothetical protein
MVGGLDVFTFYRIHTSEDIHPLRAYVYNLRTNPKVSRYHNMVFCAGDSMNIMHNRCSQSSILPKNVQK